jgi:septal ring factor EnvC (AmiA/AmiB activator)
MNTFIELFGNVTLGTIIAYCTALGALAAAIYKVYTVVIEKHDYLQNQLDTFENLKKEVNKMKEIQSELTANIGSIMKHLEKIESDLTKYSRDLDAYQKEFATIELNKLRDRLMQSYRYYASPEKNPNRAWTEIEKEAFYSMLHDYYNLQGNGYIKNTIEPEVASFTIINMSDQKAVSELMQSRK